MVGIVLLGPGCIESLVQLLDSKPSLDGQLMVNGKRGSVVSGCHACGGNELYPHHGHSSVPVPLVCQLLPRLLVNQQLVNRLLQFSARLLLLPHKLQRQRQLGNSAPPCLSHPFPFGTHLSRHLVHNVLMLELFVGILGGLLLVIVFLLHHLGLPEVLLYQPRQLVETRAPHSQRVMLLCCAVLCNGRATSAPHTVPPCTPLVVQQSRLRSS